ncbi:MAG: hypothetical protein J3Q66DRAFT_419319 [Benniella sp.]|nr:MAG: hypothetical protein J3Q66DRAFT_419319 [Benniella sp.]
MALFAMSGPTTVFDIPLLIDMICAGLTPRDIGKMASCSKEWYALFGPYRFKSIRFTSMKADRIQFLFNNNRDFIRELEMSAVNAALADASRCTRLRELTLDFGHKAGLELYDESMVHAQQKGKEWMERYLLAMTRASVGATSLLQKNIGLRTLHLRWENQYQPTRSIIKPILDAIMSLSFLTRIKLTIHLTCMGYAKILAHIPHQVMELQVGVIFSANKQVMDSCNHYNEQESMLKTRTTPLGLRRLILHGKLSCFIDRMFVSLLQDCPDLEELGLPSIELPDTDHSCYVTLAEALDSHCQHFRTLSLQRYGPKETQAKRVAVLLEKFSRGVRHLYLHDDMYNYPIRGMYNYPTRDAIPQWTETLILETLLNTTTANTIEALWMCPSDDDNDNIIRILRQCPRLQEFRLKSGHQYKGIDISDLVPSMDEPWKCWGTLRVLEIKVTNRSLFNEKSSERTWRRVTAQKVRRLCFWLKSFPRLTTVHILWNLYRNSGDFEWNNRMSLSLTSLNERANADGSRLMTEEDMSWMKLGKTW